MDIQIFNNSEFGEIRTVEENGKFLFCGSDVAKALGYARPNEAITQHCKEDGTAFHRITDSLGRNQQAKFINEGNLYRLISNRKLPTAEKFESWVFDDVLPTIRKTGMYATDELLDNPDLIISIATSLKEERAKNKALQAQAEKDKPKVMFAEAVETSHTSILVGELAKILNQNGIDIGQNRLFERLRNCGYLISRKGADYNMPTQKAMEMKLFEIKERTINEPSGSVRITKTVKVTGKGQTYFISKFLQ